ncbi:MAG: GNAT family N-acetyltransferase [Rubrivivax sp.]|nr:MAG: GNAT family N-acetyltransferase [Rubrivivax sp.]
MEIIAATPSDIDEAVHALAAAFADDAITSYLLEAGPAYPGRVTEFFTLLMRARLALGMPVLLARAPAGIHGGAMGYSTVRAEWPADLAKAWDAFEASVPGLTERLAVYDAIADRYKPANPHYYLGVLGVAPDLQGSGIGKLLLQSFCALSAADPHSSGVYLETAKPSNVPFYKAAGFKETGRGALGAGTLWCLYLPHESRESDSP